MLPIPFAALFLSLLPSAQKPPIDPAVETARTELASAFAKGDAAERVRAVEAHAAVSDEKVVELIAKGLADESGEVARAATEALRHSTHPEALQALHSFVGKARKLDDDPALYAALLRAIAQHGDPKSIPILTEGLWTAPDHRVIRARILGLGRIRAPAAVEALIDLLKVAGPRKTDPYMQEFRTALCVLTGADHGPTQEAWLAWWNENKSSLKVRKEPGELPRLLQVMWNEHWGETKRGEKRERREKRG